MNKYKEALNGAIKRTNVMNNCCSFIGECFKNGDCKFNDAKLMCDDYVCFKTLHELVEKATPKKLHKKYINLQGYYHFNFECPNCYSLICYDTATIYEKIGYRYCKICGQALDWSEEDD